MREEISTGMAFSLVRYVCVLDVLHVIIIIIIIVFMQPVVIIQCWIFCLVRDTCFSLFFLVSVGYGLLAGPTGS